MQRKANALEEKNVKFQSKLEMYKNRKKLFK